MVLNQITYFPIFGVPLIAYGGILTFISIIATIYTGAKKKPIKAHTTLATISLILASIHGLFAILAYF